MKLRTSLTFALSTVAALTMTAATAQTFPDTVDGHLQAAKQAAGVMWKGTLGALCLPDPPRPPAAAGPRPIPNHADWYAPPQKAFDNLYRLGTQVNSAWALVDPKTKDIILIDNLFNYAGKEEIIDGMKKMGLDPAKIKYDLVGHGHGDHDEYIKALQDQYHIKVGLGAPDWELMDKSDQPGGHPAHDIMVTDGQKFTVGDTTVTAVSTPGHTDGTTSWIFPVQDHGKTLIVAYSGGTLIGGFGNDDARFARYVASQQHMAQAAAAAGATVVLSNHTEYDGSYVKGELTKLRQPGEPSPFEVGADGVQRYFKVSQECTLAAKDRLKAAGS